MVAGKVRLHDGQSVRTERTVAAAAPVSTASTTAPQVQRDPVHMPAQREAHHRTSSAIRAWRARLSATMGGIGQEERGFARASTRKSANGRRQAVQRPRSSASSASRRPNSLKTDMSVGYKKFMNFRPKFLPSGSRRLMPPEEAGESRSAAATIRRTVVIATIGLWLTNFGLLTLRSFMDGQEPFWTLVMIRGGLALVGCGICYLMHVILSRLVHRSFRIRFIVAVLLAPVAAEAFAWANDIALRAAGLLPPALAGGGLVMYLGFWVWFFIAWSAMYLAVSYSTRLLADQRLLEDARDRAECARLEALRYQVNPHFLFNTLNAVSTLIMDGRPDEADAMVTRLASFFGTSLASETRDRIPLAEEIAIQRAYLEIERVRYPELEIVEAVDADAAAARVPTLILQPIIENAVKFGVTRASGPARITIEARRIGGTVRLRVLDDGRADPSQPGTGTGLRNVRERLRTIYGGRASLAAGPRAEGGYQVEISLPA